MTPCIEKARDSGTEGVHAYLEALRTRRYSTTMFHLLSLKDLDFDLHEVECRDGVSKPGVVLEPPEVQLLRYRLSVATPNKEALRELPGIAQHLLARPQSTSVSVISRQMQR